MVDISSISFESSIKNSNIVEEDSIDFALALLMCKLLSTLQQLKAESSINNAMYFKMVELILQVQKKFNSFKNQCLQAHLRSLENIQILLFQQDYNDALAKIDEYKKIKLTDLSKKKIMIELVQKNKQKQKNLTFQQQKAIIKNEFSSFQLKQKIWLKYAMQKLQRQQQLEHVTYSKVQFEQTQQFKREFNEQSERTETLTQKIHNLLTPQKKNEKSMSYLKKQYHKQKGNNSLKSRKLQSKQKSTTIITSEKRSSEKRTTKKKMNKEPQQHKTNKKQIVSFLV